MEQSKKDFLLKDRIIKGIHKGGFFKISVVKTTRTVQEAQSRHNLSPLASIVMAKALTANMLLASELKGEERINLRIEGNGVLGTIVTEANKVGEMRGFVQNPDATIDPTIQSLEDGVGFGTLTLTKTLYNEAKPRTSTIEIVRGDIQSDVQHYLTQSEQINSIVILDIDFDEDGSIRDAGGLMIQMLPDAPTEAYEQLLVRVKSIPRLTSLFDDDIYIDKIMEDATGNYEVKELERYPVDFYCRCSKDRFAGALALLNLSDLEEIEGSEQEMCCHYCNEKYHFDAEEINAIVSAARAKMN